MISSPACLNSANQVVIICSQVESSLMFVGVSFKQKLVGNAIKWVGKLVVLAVAVRSNLAMATMLS